MPRTIIVTQLDIDTGKRFSAYTDALALAMNRVFDETVGVGLNTWWKKGEHFKDIMLPDEAVTFRQLFDAGKKVSPFIFEVDDD